MKAIDHITAETPCPACGAPAGTPCVWTLDGKTYTAPHDARAFAHWGFRNPANTPIQMPDGSWD